MPQRTLMLQTTFYAFYLALGAGIFSSIENWNYVDGIYFSHYTLLTIGLGSDFPLYETSARILLIPYAFLGVIFLGLIISSIRSLFLSRAKQKVRLRALDQERTRLRKKRNSCPEHNFQLMRRTQNAADRSRKYWGLTSSATATLSLWLLGALVFYFSERHRPQHWSYWNAIYFSYTTLLTIGYGDFFPVSMSGKPFFVVWSMLAVPTMTIFISTMGDTVVGWVKKATFWISRRTILPEKHGEDEKSGNVGDGKDIGTDDGVHMVRLAREIKRVAADVGSTPPKRYEWDRWQMWLELLGVNEEEAEWSWLGDEGPLMSGVTETEWVLEKLCARLEEIAKAERKGK
jgi:potassium channel subfamily K